MPTFKQRFEGDPYNKFASSPNVEDRTGDSTVDKYIGAAISEILYKAEQREDYKRKSYSGSAHAEAPFRDAATADANNPLSQALGSGDLGKILSRHAREDEAEMVANKVIQGK